MLPCPTSLWLPHRSWQSSPRLRTPPGKTEAVLGRGTGPGTGRGIRSRFVHHGTDLMFKESVLTRRIILGRSASTPMSAAGVHPRVWHQQPTSDSSAGGSSKLVRNEVQVEAVLFFTFLTDLQNLILQRQTSSVLQNPLYLLK